MFSLMTTKKRLPKKTTSPLIYQVGYQGLVDLSEFDLREKLKRAYAIFSYGGHLRYQSGIYKYLQDEFHPQWNTLIKNSNRIEIKVECKTFCKETDQLESADFLWFDVSFKKNYVEAICQINSDIKFLILGKKGTKFYQKMAPDLFARLDI